MFRKQNLYKTTFAIVNVVTTANLEQNVNVIEFAKYLWGRYDTDIHNGKCGYIKTSKMRGRVSVFFSGKMISTGAISVVESIRQLEQSMETMSDFGLIKKIKLEPKVQNIVATASVGNYLNIKMISQRFDHTIYEPELFAGLIYRSKYGPKCLIFASGKVVIAGAKTETQIKDILDDLTSRLHELES